MTQVEIPENQPATIQIGSVGCDLRLRGWDRHVVSTKDNSVELAETEPGTVAASSAGDVNLRIPHDSTVTVETVGSDAKITDLTGPLTLGAVGRDLILRGVGSVMVQNVGSDLRIRRAEGDVTIVNVGEDATIREVEGRTTIENVGADLFVRDVKNGCRAENVGADLVLSTDFAPEAEYYFCVGGDIVCRVPPQASVRFRVPADAEVSLDAAGVNLVEGDEYDEFVVGKGEALVELRAGGDIRLVTQEEDYLMAINFQLEGDLEERLAGIEEQLAEHLSGLDEVIAAKAERIREKAERQAERAMRHAERAIRKSRKHGFRFVIGDREVEFGAPRPPKPPRPPEPVEPVTDDERLMILKMVEKGQLSVEEAEKLLAALEGR
jgi:hypothetical protein